MFITRNKLTPLILLSAAALALTGAPRATESPGRTVSLYATVEKDGGLVQGLEAGNFRLYEDGEALPVKLAKPEKPASVALLVEYSESSWYYLNDISSAMEGFMNSAPDGNWYALATFAHELNIAVDFTKQRGEIADGFSNLARPMWDEVDTYDALYRMLDIMGRLPGRRILIFIGSGFDTLSSHTLDEVKEKLESVNVVVYGVGAGSMLRGSYEPYLGSSARLSLLQAEAFVKMLADRSGGQAWFPRFEGAFPDVMKGVMQSIENQYRLVYQSRAPADGDFHKIELKAFVVKNDQRQDFKVRVRDGWRFGSS